MSWSGAPVCTKKKKSGITMAGATNSGSRPMLRMKAAGHQQQIGDEAGPAGPRLCSGGFLQGQGDGGHQSSSSVSSSVWSGSMRWPVSSRNTSSSVGVHRRDLAHRRGPVEGGDDRADRAGAVDGADGQLVAVGLDALGPSMLSTASACVPVAGDQAVIRSVPIVRFSSSGVPSATR